LVRWCLPLLADRGSLLAIKGAQAEAEVATHSAAIQRLGGERPTVRTVGTALLPEPTTVVVVRKSAATARRKDAG
jgi:16S rRNA (guanine527-N7)-methyltransferase